MNNEEIDNLSQQAIIAGQIGQHAQSVAATQYYSQEQDRTMADTQLEVVSLLEEIYHNLRQDETELKEDGTISWKENSNPEQRFLTDKGVERIMQLMKFYVNKNTLLSNFTEEQIKKRMLEFSLALNANIFMKYEHYFREPTLEECKEVLRKRVEEKVKIKMFANEFLNLVPDKERITDKILSNIGNRIEYELQKIKEESRRNNLREYELLFVQLKAVVEATHNRAWRGEERGSLRRHMNVSEIIGSPNQRNVKESGGSFKWLKS